MPRVLVILLAAGLVVTVAVAEGLRSDRWGASPDVTAAAARLEGVPREFDGWVGKDVPLDPKLVEKAEAAGYVNRVYTSKTGEQFTVMILCGLSGPIGAHTPEVCYGGMGYHCVGKPLPTRINLVTGGGANFWHARFEKRSPTDNPLRVLWGWGFGGDWQNSRSPRTEFAMHKVLYKMYVVRTDKPNDPLINEFLAEFLPLVKTALTPG